jgi:hypothetical protein
MNSLAIAGSAPSLNIERIEVRKSVTRKFWERTALQLYLLVDEYSANISISVLAGSLAPSEL